MAPAFNAHDVEGLPFTSTIGTYTVATNEDTVCMQYVRI